MPCPRPGQPRPGNPAPPTVWPQQYSAVCCKFPRAMSRESYRLSQLPPYVLARVDELKTRLRAEGREIFDFGLGNPDGPSPAAAIARLQKETETPGFQRYMPSKGVPEARQAICDWYRRRYAATFDPETEAAVTIGSKE